MSKRKIQDSDAMEDVSTLVKAMGSIISKTEKRKEELMAQLPESEQARLRKALSGIDLKTAKANLEREMTKLKKILK